MAIELPKIYDPKAAQEKWLTFWEERGFFHSDPDPSRKPYTIVIPPPNVTGALHMGHALNNTLQDVLIRWRRMQGFNALCMPGTGRLPRRFAFWSASSSETGVDAQTGSFEPTGTDLKKELASCAPPGARQMAVRPPSAASVIPVT